MKSFAFCFCKQCDMKISALSLFLIFAKQHLNFAYADVDTKLSRG